MTPRLIAQVDEPSNATITFGAPFWLADVGVLPQPPDPTARVVKATAALMGRLVNLTKEATATEGRRP
ncbi:MAG: hypothetical protein WBC51_25250 [Vicinamibacterales bacterium]